LVRISWVVSKEIEDEPGPIILKRSYNALVLIYVYFFFYVL
jgi:hypothetical protein